MISTEVLEAVHAGEKSDVCVWPALFHRALCRVELAVRAGWLPEWIV